MKGLLRLLALILLWISCGSWVSPGIWYWMDGDVIATNCKGTRTELQKVLDKASATRRLWVQLNPNTSLDCDSTIWVHGNTTIQGPGRDLATFKRTRFNPADPADAGHLLISAPYGQHRPNNALVGGLPSDSLESITLSGFTLDGNCQAWPDVNPNIAGNFGIQMWFVDGAQIIDVGVKNTLQTGIELDACRNSLIDRVRTELTGQEQMLGTRNGININNNSGSLNASVNWARRITVQNCWIINQKDAGMDCANVSEVTMLNNRFFCDHDTTYGNMVHEWEGSLAGYVMHDFLIEGSVAIGLNNEFFQEGLVAANLQRLTIRNCYFKQGDSPVEPSRARWAFLVGGNGRARWTRDVLIEGCTFDNMNAGNAGPAGGAGRLAYIAGDTLIADSTHCGNITIRDCTFRGVNQAHGNNSNHGLDITGNVDGVTVENCRFYGVEDIGVFVHNTTRNRFVRNVRLEGVYIDGAMQEAVQIGASTGTAIPSEVNGVDVVGCTGKDVNGEVAQPSIFVGALTSGETTKNIRIQGCRLIRTSGTNMQGLKLHQANGAVLDSVWLIDNDFDGVAAPVYTVTGTIPSIFRSDVTGSQRYLTTGQVFDNNVWLKWKNSSGSDMPIAKVDSSNTLRVQAPSNGSQNIDFMNAAGAVAIRFYGSTGNWNLVAPARRMYGGYDWAYDNANDRRLLQKSTKTDGTAGIVVRDSANAVDQMRIAPGGRTWIGAGFTSKDSVTAEGALYAKTTAFVADSARVGKSFTLGSYAFASLPASPWNGMVVYCTDCTKATPTAGGGSGALVVRINGAWDGNP